MATDILAAALTAASDLELRDFISERITKADALAAHTYGESGDSFRNLTDALQDNYLWALADLLREVKQAQAELVEREHHRTFAGDKFVEIPVIGRAS